MKKLALSLLGAGLLAILAAGCRCCEHEERIAELEKQIAELQAKLAAAEPKSLADLKAMPGYAQDVLSAKKSAFAIAGSKWNARTTWYYTRGRVLRGDKADARKLEPGARIFYLK